MPLSSTLAPTNAVFVLLSFEGPDAYSQAGGLGIRISSLAETLAQQGFETHLFFIGDPALPGEEHRVDGRLILHRWCQWISAYRPGGVYDGEEVKLQDFTTSLPPYLLQHVLLPALAEGRIPIVLSEEWQTAEAAADIAESLETRGLRDRALMFWNANNSYSFERIDWWRLATTNTITAVSQYMRGILRARGIDALVVPNGIPQRLLAPVDRMAVRRVRGAMDGATMLFKMARWEWEKGWLQALDAVRLLRDRESRTVLVARAGGPSGEGAGITAEAHARGLKLVDLRDPRRLAEDLAAAVAADADVVAIRFGIDESTARVLYAAANGVLANSVSEPFGLVGLEAMAAGGVVFTGGTGEDYAVSGQNAVVLETLDPREIVERTECLAGGSTLSSRLRRAARATAVRYTWNQVSRTLLGRLGDVARRQGLLDDAPAVDMEIVRARRSSLPFARSRTMELREAMAP